MPMFAAAVFVHAGMQRESVSITTSRRVELGGELGERGALEVEEVDRDGEAV